MKTVEKYETIDGKVFDTEEAASKWESKVYKASGALVASLEWFNECRRLSYSYTDFIKELSLAERVQMVREK